MQNLKEEPQLANLRAPRPEDGASVHGLVANCPPLDGNSMYCNLLQCTHFSDTCVAAELDGELVGFVSGYIPPATPNVFFCWQMAVGEKARGQGLAKRMLREILQREHCAQVSFLETTITESNEASWAVFQSLAKDLNCELSSSVMFDRERHFNGEHATEMLVRLGPFVPRQKN
ncbi:L-2,4-diaminobutyric acid acetyltransferase [Thalassocella blandensis]|nr:L-2,4-diaminobutyric acid acetyltransferase [Thalassocella blandensis]